MKFPSIIRSGLLLLRGLLPTIVLLVQPAAGGELEEVTKALRAEKAAAEDNGKDEAKNDAKNAAKSVPWLLSLGEGHRRALAEQKPVLVRVGADWCPVCRKLAGEIDNPAVQTELARWTPVYVDADRSLEDSKELNVTVVPSLRIRTPRGAQVASRDGYLSAEDLVAWLKEHYEAAAAAPDEVLFDSDEPDPLAVVRLVRQLNSRNPAVREAAIRRLLPYPKIARPAVVKTFSEGKLTARRSRQAGWARLAAGESLGSMVEGVLCRKAWSEVGSRNDPAATEDAPGRRCRREDDRGADTGTAGRSPTRVAGAA